ncbi:MAG: hypothetical protein OEZ43_11335 [Gammaproteobacteria bacterium]|nr:hypothetical protein [Gammaproteobacteria bacterium]
MMGYNEFQRLSKDPNAKLHIARFYDTATTNRSGKLTSHEIGWTIRAIEPGKRPAYGYFHVHWKPKVSQYATFEEISAHFKESHRGNRSENRNTNAADLKPIEAAMMYNTFRMWNALWDDRSHTAPNNAKKGWTQLKCRITKPMVDHFKKHNNSGALKVLAQNPLYELDQWDQDAWVSFLGWLTGVEV